MNGERGRGAEEAEGEENESARRLRAREPLFLDLAHFSMPVDSYPNLPSLSLSLSPARLHLFYLLPIRLLFVPSGPSRVFSTSDAFATFCRRFNDRRFLPLRIHYRKGRRHQRVFALVGAFQKTVRARVRPASLVTTDKRC